MLEREITIINKLGLHARAAAKLVGLAGQFACEVTLKRNEREVNGKSIMGVMMLAAAQGAQLTLRTSGSDEGEAMAQIQALIDDRFGEGE